SAMVASGRPRKVRVIAGPNMSPMLEAAGLEGSDIGVIRRERLPFVACRSGSWKQGTLVLPLRPSVAERPVRGTFLALQLLTNHPRRRVLMATRWWRLSRCGGLFVAALTIASPVAATPVEDAYIAGYAAAVLDQDSRLKDTPVSVHDGIVTVERPDLDAAERRRATAALDRIRGVKQVSFADAGAPPPAPTIAAAPSPTPPNPAQSGASSTVGVQTASTTSEGLVLLPGGKLFDPLIADPRTPHFGASFVHINNASELESGAAVSFGETVPLLETAAPFAGGKLQVGLLASLFSLFDTGSRSEDLIDSDYLIGVPVSWRKGRWSGQARYLHQSSHLGDELLLRPTHPQRV